MYRPLVLLLIEFGPGDAGVELHIAFEVVTLGHMLEVAQDFGLLGVALTLFPFLQELLVKGEAVNIGIGVAARAGVTVPVPGAANGFTRFINPHLQSQFIAKRLEHVHTGKTCTDDDGIKVLSCASHVYLQ